MSTYPNLRLCLAALLFTGACTSSEPEKSPLPELEIQAPTQLTPSLEAKLKQSPDRYKMTFKRSFENLQENNEIRREQVELLIRNQLARQRGQMIGAILSGDVDNDGDLTTNELLTVAMDSRIQSYFGRGRSGYSESKLPVTQGDRNGDGIFSAEEIRQFANLFVDMDTVIENQAALSLMAFDTNTDGILTRDEFEDELAAFKDAQPKRTTPKSYSDKNPSERQAVQQKLRDEACKADLKLTDDAEFILLSGYEGTALSTVAVTGPYQDTEVARIIIEPGDRPLFIVAGTYTDMIWSVEGDTDRVSGFVARKSRRSSSAAGTGVVGLPKKKVDFIDGSCFGYFYKEKDSASILTKARFNRIYGRPVDKIIAHYSLDAVTLPTGMMNGKTERLERRRAEKQSGVQRTKITDGISLSAKDNYDSAKKTALYRFFEDGIAYVDPNKVVAPGPVETYEVYPDHAGIAQLLDSGHLEKLESETYYIRKNFKYFPAGLGGAHSVRFILGKGVKSPGGSPGHSALIDEATGQCEGARCPRDR